MKLSTPRLDEVARLARLLMEARVGVYLRHCTWHTREELRDISWLGRLGYMRVAAELYERGVRTAEAALTGRGKEAGDLRPGAKKEN